MSPLRQQLHELRRSSETAIALAEAQAATRKPEVEAAVAAAAAALINREIAPLVARVDDLERALTDLKARQQSLTLEIGAAQQIASSAEQQAAEASMRIAKVEDELQRLVYKLNDVIQLAEDERALAGEPRASTEGVPRAVFRRAEAVGARKQRRLPDLLRNLQASRLFVALLPLSPAGQPAVSRAEPGGQDHRRHQRHCWLRIWRRRGTNCGRRRVPRAAATSRTRIASGTCWCVERARCAALAAKAIQVLLARPDVSPEWLSRLAVQVARGRGELFGCSYVDERWRVTVTVIGPQRKLRPLQS